MSRRMFSDEVTKTDAFLDMPTSSQLLYFHLGMEADDDGFVPSPRMVMRVIGASNDDLKLLFAKKFLLSFENGVCVVKHWRINNQIRKDRYTETTYLKEKGQLYIRENGSYTFTKENALPVPKGHFLPARVSSGNQVATIGQPSIGKESIGKERKEKEATPEKVVIPADGDLSFLPDWLDAGVWYEWAAYRRGIKKKLTEASIKMQIKFLSQHQSEYKLIIEQSIMNGWTGLFALKGNARVVANVLKTSHTKTVSEKMQEKADKNK